METTLNKVALTTLNERLRSLTMKAKTKASLPCHLEFHHKESKPRKVTPSFYTQEMMQSTEERFANINVIHPPRILELFQTCLITHTKSFVPLDQACFLSYPSEMVFQNYCPSQTYEFPLLLFNNDKVSRHVRLQNHDSEHFVVMSPEDARIKVAPGLSVTFTVFFTPRENKDYQHKLIFATEREKFEIPIRAIGPRAILDFRDELHLPTCPVKSTTQRTQLVRNIGNSRAMFILETQRPFSVSPTTGTLDVGESMQVTVDYTPMNPGDHRHDLKLHYHTGEDVFISLYGTCEELDIHLEPDSALLEKTYISLCTTYKVSLHNSSSIPITYHWTTWASQQEEDKARDLVLLREAENKKHLQSIHTEGTGVPLLSSATIESRSHHENDHLLALSHRCICMEPAEGDIWPNTTTVFNIVFKPDESKLYQRTIYCDITGKECRVPLTIKGQGLGPRLELNYHFMNMKNVFQNDNDSYEVILSNKGLIDAPFKLSSPDSTFGRCFSFSPEQGVVIPGACQIVQVTFHSSVLGTFSEDLLLTVRGQPEQRTLTFRGCVIGPTFHFNVSELNFGDVAFGFPQTAICTLFNTSYVPMTFALRVLGDGMGSSSVNSAKQLSDLCRNNWQGNSVPDRYASPVEFSVSPADGTLRAMSDLPIKVTLCSNTVKKYRLALAVDVDGVGEEVMALPINARCVVPEIIVEPPVLDMQRCFLNHPYKKQVRLINNSALPACYGVLDQDFEQNPSLVVGSSLPRGLIGPHSFEELPVLMLAKAVGKLQHTLHIAVFGSLQPPLEVKFICIGQGPLVYIQSRQMDFGRIPVLTDVTRTIRMFNQSPIPARFTAKMTQGSRSMWRVEPDKGEVSAEGQLEIQVVAHLRDTVLFKDWLELSIHDSQTHMVLLSAVGTGTTIISDRPFCPSLDLGTHFSHGVCRYSFTLTNYGQRAHLMYWKADVQSLATRSQDSSSSSGRSSLPSIHSKGRKKEMSGSLLSNSTYRPVFSISPNRLELFPGCSVDMVLSGSSGIPKVVHERLYCQGIVGQQGNIEDIMAVEVKCRFVAPVLNISTKLLKFYTEKVPGKDLVPLYEILLLQNISSLPLSMEVTLAAPFSLCEACQAYSPATSKAMVLGVGKQAEMWVCFDPSFCQDRTSRIVDEIVNVRYEGHPKQDTVHLHGEVHFPNLLVSSNSLDFGCVLNCTENHREVTIANCSPLPVKYRWVFLVKAPSPPRLVEQQRGGDGDAERTLSLMSIPEDVRVSQSSMCLEEVFDVVPIHGYLHPGAQQLVTFSFYGRDNVSREVVAQCRVEEGPDYQVRLRGEAAEIGFSLDQTLVDFGLQRFDEAAEALLTLTNTGKVGFDFHMERPQADETQEQLPDGKTLEQIESTLEIVPGLPLILPSMGHISAGKQQHLRILFLPGVPDTFQKRLQLVVGHLPPRDITLTGEGVFARISLNLPRRFTEATDADALHQARAAVEADRVRQEQNGVAERGTSAWTSSVFTYEELLHLEMERVLVQGHALAVTKTLLAQRHSQGSIRKWNRLSRFALPEYVLEFGFVIPGQIVSNTVNVTNPGPVTVSFQVNAKPLAGTGFSVEFDRVKNLPCGEIQTLMVRFDPQACHLRRGEVDVLLPIQTSGGPVVQVRLVAVVTVPTVTPSTETLRFDTVQCGMCEIRTIQLINSEPVPCSWTIAEVVKSIRKVGKFLPLHLHKKYYQENRPPPVVFEGTPSSGVLPSGERVNVQIKFSPNDEGVFERQLVVHMVDNQRPFFVSVLGQAEMPRLEFCPPQLDLFPSLPLSLDVEAEVKVKNPCPFSIEFYSLEFDTQFLEEDKIMRMMPGYDQNRKLLLPPRVPGKSLPPELLDFYQSGGDEGFEDAVAAGEEKQTEEGTCDASQKTYKTSEIFFSEAIHRGSSEQLGQLEMNPVSKAIARHMGLDLSPEGLAARNRRGIAVIVYGAPQTDKSSMAVALAQYYGATCLTLDAVVKEALLNGSSPVSLTARQQVDKISAKFIQKKGIHSLQSSRAAMTSIQGPNGAQPTPQTAPQPTPQTAPQPTSQQIPQPAPHTAPQPTPHHAPQLSPPQAPQDTPTDAHMEAHTDSHTDAHTDAHTAPHTDSHQSSQAPPGSRKSKPTKHIRSESKALLESESRTMAACLKVDVTSISTLLSEQLLVDLLAERLQMSDCHRGVVINGLESIYVQPVTNTLQLVLKALNNRKHIYLVNMVDSYAALKGREKAKVKALEAELKERAEEDERRLHEMDEDEYEALPEDQREKIDRQRKEQKLRELERIAKQQEEKKLLEEIKKRQMEEMKKRYKKSGKKDGRELSRKKSSMDQKTSGSPPNQTSSENSKESLTDPRAPQEEDGELNEVREKVPSPRQQEENQEDKPAEPQEAEPEKEASRHDEVQARFKAYEQNQGRVAHILQHWDRHQGVLLVGVPTDEASLGSDASVDKPTPVSKRPKKTRIHSPLQNQSLHVSVPHVALKLNGTDFPSLSEILQGRRLPHLDQVLDHLGIGPKGPPIPPPVRFDVVSYPENRERASDEPTCENFQFLSPFAAEGLTEETKDAPEEEELLSAAVGKMGGKGGIKEATMAKEREKRDRDSQKSRRRPSAKQKTKGADQSPSDGGQQDQLQASLELKRSQRLRVFRWVVPAHGEVLLKIWFFSESSGTFQQVFNFELLGVQSKYQLVCNGLSTFPSICRSPQTLFHFSKHVPQKEAGLKKTYVAKPGYYEFGPLLCSKNRDRYKENKHPDNLERLLIHNNSGMEAEVRFRFQVDTQAATFILDPPSMNLQPDQKQCLSIWGFPTKVGQIQDTLLCCIRDNPEMVSVPLSCWGVRPELELEGKQLQFDRVLLNRWDSRSLNVHNRTALPAFWRLQGLEDLGEGFSAPQDHGTVPPFSTFALTLQFRACKLLPVKKIIRLEVSDVDNIFGITHTENIQVTAEGYDIALDVIPDGQLDFGVIKVFEASELCLKLKNQGKYEFAYRFVLVRTDPGQPDPDTIFTVTPKSGTLAPHKKPTAFEIVCKPESEVTFVEQTIIRCQVIEPNCPPETEVIGCLNIKVSVQSVFSRCVITPAYDINFGPLVYGSKRSQSFILENKGCFETRYNMAWSSGDIAHTKCPRRRHREAQAKMAAGLAAKARADSTAAQRITMGVFSVFPSSGILQPASHQQVTVECVAEQLGKCSQGMFIDIGDRDPSDHPEGIPYTLLAEICKPGIIMDLTSIFEEHNLCQNSSQLSYEHICNQEGTFIVDESRFVFARVLVGRCGQARFKIVNNTKVPCTLALAINYFGIKLSTNVEVFTMPSTSMTVASQSHSFIVITFTPQAMNHYSAVFEAVFLEGSTRLMPKVLEFELVGEGCLPSVCVVRPVLKNHEGNPALMFRRVMARRKQSQSLVLLNDGNLTAQLTVDMLDKFGLFSLRVASPDTSCTFTTTQIEGAAEPEPQLVHRAVLSLEVNRQVELEVSVCSEKVLSFSSRVCVQVEDNYYCSTVVEVSGEIFQEILSIDNLSSPVTETEEDEDADGQYEVLNFGDCHVDCSYQESFTMTNHSSSQSLRFEWPVAGPQICFAPQVGHLHAGCSKEVTVSFFSAQPATVASQSMRCKVCEVDFEQPLEQVPDWDDQHKTVQWVVVPGQPAGTQQPLQTKVIEVDPEPACTPLAGSKLELDLRVSAVCDFAKFKFGSDSVHFKDTMLYQSRIHEMQMTNRGNVRLDFYWQVHMGSSSNQNQGDGTMTPRPQSSLGRMMAGDRPSSALASVMTLLMGNPELPPFSVEPSVGSVPPGAEQTFTVRFSPLEVTRFQGMLLCSIPNLQSEDEPPFISVSGRCLLPHCHFDLEDCGYLSDNRRNPAFNCHLDPDTRVVEFTAVGFSAPITRSFNVVNPTSKPFTFKWKTRDTGESLFFCLTPTGTVLPGKKMEMCFQYLAKHLDMVESLWSFTIESLSLSFPFLCVGSTREPMVYLEKPHLDFGERVVGCAVEKTMCLVNAEDEPLNFSVTESSLVCDKQHDRLGLEPMSGTVGPRERLPLLVTFTATQEGHVNFRLVIKVKKRSQPIVLPVKADCFAMNTCVQVQNPEGDLREVAPGTPDTLDFGKVGVSEQAAFEILVSNMARCSLELEVELLGPAAQLEFLEAKPTYLHIDVAAQKSVSLTFSPQNVCSVQDVKLNVKVQHGPRFTFLLRGRGEEPGLEFSFTRFNFGKCFLFRHGMNPPTTSLSICNRDKKDISIQCQFRSTSFLKVGFQPDVLSPGAVMEIPITFYPDQVRRYHETLTFILHSCVTREVDILGQGFEMKLEVDEPKQKVIKLGSMVGQSVRRKAVLSNHSLLDLPLKLILDSRLDIKDLSFSPMGDVVLNARGGTCSIDVSFSPRQHVPAFSAELQGEFCGLLLPLFSIQGRSQGVEVQLDVNHLPFGAVVQHCRIKKKLVMMNVGDIGAKFRWKSDNFPAELSVEPLKGYISPGKEITFEVTFAPVQLSSDIRFENLSCHVEGFSSPVAFTVTASCITATTNREVVNFICPVRGIHHQLVSVTNPTNQPCTIRPMLEGGQWRGAPSLMLEPNQTRNYEITYKPLTMSLDGKRDHGSLFFSFPDGTGMLFLLLGLAEAPEPETTIMRELPAKTEHEELLPVVNWLTKQQRFVVKMDHLKMDKHDTTLSLKGLDYIDVPALAKKDYKFTFYAYREGNYNTKVSFLNEESGEFLFHLVTFRTTASGSLATFELVSSVRKKTSASIRIRNPLTSANTLNVECKCHEVSAPAHYIVPEHAEGTMTFEYLPIRPGESTARLSLYSSELGFFHYDLVLKALAPPPEKTVHFSASLGSSQTLGVKFMNYSRFKTEYSCKSDCPEFIVDRCVGASAGHLAGSTVSVDVSFEPHQMGEVKGQLSLSSGTGGEYTFPLHGVCHVPKAQGPYNIRSGRTINISFKNVFPQTTSFSFQVDNPLFTIKGIETILSKRSQSILVSFEAPAGDSPGPWFGKMTVSSQRSDGNRKPCTWVYYLKGFRPGSA